VANAAKDAALKQGLKEAAAEAIRSATAAVASQAPSEAKRVALAQKATKLQAEAISVATAAAAAGAVAARGGTGAAQTRATVPTQLGVFSKAQHSPAQEIILSENLTGWSFGSTNAVGQADMLTSSSTYSEYLLGSLSDPDQSVMNNFTLFSSTIFNKNFFYDLGNSFKDTIGADLGIFGVNPEEKIHPCVLALYTLLDKRELQLKTYNETDDNDILLRKLYEESDEYLSSIRDYKTSSAYFKPVGRIQGQILFSHKEVTYKNPSVEKNKLLNFHLIPSLLGSALTTFPSTANKVTIGWVDEYENNREKFLTNRTWVEKK